MNMNLNDEHVKTLPIKDKDHVQILHFLYTFKLPIGLDDECLSSLCVLLDEGKENFSSKDKAVKTYSSLFSNLCELFLKDEKLKGKFPKRSPYHNTIHAYLFIIQRLDTGLNDVSFYLLGNFIVILNTIKFFHFELPEYEEEVCRFSENFSKGRLKFTQMIFNKGSDTGIIKLFIKICLALALKTQKITHYLNAQRKSDLSKYSQRNRRSGAFTKNEEELCKILFTDKYIKMNTWHKLDGSTNSKKVMIDYINNNCYMIKQRRHLVELIENYKEDQIFVEKSEGGSELKFQDDLNEAKRFFLYAEDEISKCLSSTNHMWHYPEFVEIFRLKLQDQMSEEEIYKALILFESATRHPMNFKRISSKEEVYQLSSSESELIGQYFSKERKLNQKLYDEERLIPKLRLFSNSNKYKKIFYYEMLNKFVITTEQASVNDLIIYLAYCVILYRDYKEKFLEKLSESFESNAKSSMSNFHKSRIITSDFEDEETNI